MIRAAGPIPRSPRLLIVLVAGALVLAGAAGLTQWAAFEQPSTLKYALLVVGPLAIVWAAGARRPLDVLVVATVLAIPAADFHATLLGEEISPLALLLVASVTVAVVSGAPPRDRSALWYAAAAIAVLLAVPIAIGSAPLHYTTLLLTIAALGWVVSRVAARGAGFVAVCWALVLAATLQALLALWEWRTGHRLNLYGDIGQSTFDRNRYFFRFGDESRPSAMLPDPISLGHFLSLSLPLAVGLAVRESRRQARLAALGAALVVSAGLMVTLSRTSWIGAAAGIVAATVLLPRGRRLAAAGVLTAVAVLAVVMVATGPTHTFAQRAQSILSPTSPANATDQGDRQRLQLWSVAARAGDEHASTGVGLGNLQPRLRAKVDIPTAGVHAHSTYLQLYAEAGLAGLAALAVLLVAFGRDLAVRARTERVLCAAVAGAMLTLLVDWSTDYSVRYLSLAAPLAVLVGLAASRPVDSPTTR